MSKAIGLVGVGLIGSSLAELLLEAGYDVVGYDIVPERCQHLESLGGKAVASPAEVGQSATRIVLSLMDSTIVQEVIEGPNGLLSADKKPTIIIDTSTGNPESTIKIAEDSQKQGVHYLDAAISGSSQQVRDREAVFMVGGNRDAYDQACDIFGFCSKGTYYLGGSGAGVKAKLANNLILGLNRLALAEGLVFAESLGLDLDEFLAVCKSSPAYSQSMDAKGEMMLKGDYEPQSRIRQHLKDVSIMLEHASNHGQPLPVTALHQSLLTTGVDLGRAEEDNAAIIEVIRSLKKPS
jgi:3-hydroxyisobutyrate dehydrogenase-like beta-hydroxyacid dehydrogenase